jgi:hypothetical protein
MTTVRRSPTEVTIQSKRLRIIDSGLGADDMAIGSTLSNADLASVSRSDIVGNLIITPKQQTRYSQVTKITVHKKQSDNINPIKIREENVITLKVETDADIDAPKAVRGSMAEGTTPCET